MKKSILWPVFALYVLVSGYTISQHELWGDEVHSWNISKGSGSYSELIANRRYEGHPPGWYTILWSISRFTHKTGYMQVAQWVIACGVIFLILFYSPFPPITRILLPFGYYMLYEYAVFSRNYAIGVLLVCCICLIIRKEFRYQPILYYILLFCLSNTHLLALLLAGSLHLYYLLQVREQKKSTGTLLLHIMAGGLIFLPALYFIFPPSNSALNTHYWVNRWNIHQLTASVEGPIRSMLPVPAWWKYNFWNTQFLIEAKKDYYFLKVFNLLVAIFLVALGFFILRANKKCLALFGANLLLSAMLSVAAFPLTSARYAGFIFIGFIAAYWLYCDEALVTQYNNQVIPDRRFSRGNRLVNILLGIHFLAGLFAVIRDIRLPFSNLYRVNELVREVPPGERMVTDYWTANCVVAFTDKPAWCIDMQKEISFVLWNPDILALMNNPQRYTTGLQQLFQKEGLRTVYMISLGSPQTLPRADPQMEKTFHVHLVDKLEGAIEKGSNLYLYRITE